MLLNQQEEMEGNKQNILKFLFYNYSKKSNQNPKICWEVQEGTAVKPIYPVYRF